MRLAMRRSSTTPGACGDAHARLLRARHRAQRRRGACRGPASRPPRNRRSEAMTETEQTEKRGDVIVGVDGSAGARAALLWAATEAQLRETRLRVVHAWRFTYPEVAGYGWGGSIEVLPQGGMSDLHQAAEA